jgi:DNA-binding NtrC family response regulator
MTAAAPEALLKQALAEGTYRVFFKPFKIEQMIDTVDDALHRIAVLVLSDDASYYSRIGGQLMVRNVRCVVLPEGGQVLSVLQQKRPEVVLVDFRGDQEKNSACAASLRDAFPDLALIEAGGTGTVPAGNRRSVSPVPLEKILETVDTIRAGNSPGIILPSVLLVETDAVLSQSLSGVLRDNRFGVVAKGTGKEAIEELGKNSYDAVIVDLSLPDMSGIDLVRKIKEGERDTIVILVAEHESVELAIDAIKERVFDFLPKPVDGRNLTKSLRKALRNRNN